MLSGTTGRRRIYLMRHGHVDYFSPAVATPQGLRDVVLTPRGRMEADAAARALAQIAFDRAICSGLPRTRETAEIILSLLADPPELEIESALEEIHIGRPQVTSKDELIATMAFHFSKAGEPGATMLEGGEVFASAQARAIAAVRRLLSEPSWKQILIVAHEAINRLILSWASGAGLLATQAFEQDTGCINVMDFDMVPAEDGEHGPQIERALIKAVNLTPYNYVKHGMNLTSLETIFARDDRDGSD
ncbi:MAG TPA: histidine phosphatase family protein [Rhizomicrobium sp.]|nr:histidine phosphatase family protein [Rhizomicrobium sp.]